MPSIEPEPAWRVAPLSELVAQLVPPSVAGRPRIVAVDGRSASGKTTLAARIADAVRGAVVVHTDDVAWAQSVFDWTDLLVDGVLRPARDGAAVAYRPPAWDERGRPGAIVVPAGAPLLVVEGVGSSRQALNPWLDAAVWVHVEPITRQRRDQARVAAGEVAADVVAAWLAEEIPFLADDRPWTRATVIVAGTPRPPHDPTLEVVLARRRR